MSYVFKALSSPLYFVLLKWMNEELIGYSMRWVVAVKTLDVSLEFPSYDMIGASDLLGSEACIP